MIDVSIISIEDFKDKIYNDYEKLFPEEEQRDWIIIEDNYNKGIEEFLNISSAMVSGFVEQFLVEL